ncbi:hypothetical protein [Peribacillus simplex]
MIIKSFNNCNGGVVPPLVGLKEFAELLGWDKARLSTKYSRQRDGKKTS